jgi:hypothetical protein
MVLWARRRSPATPGQHLEPARGSGLSVPRSNRARHPLRAHLHRQAQDQSQHVFAGQIVGIREVDDGIWLVSFMHYDLGYIDLEQKTLQTIDNPFGTRLSPMS